MKKILLILGILSILILSACVQTPPQCRNTQWNPDASTICSETTFTQTSNCGNTRNVVGTKVCLPQNVCNEPTTLDGFSNAFRILYGTTLNIGGTIYNLYTHIIIYVFELFLY